jgi:hypothetical protein
MENSIVYAVEYESLSEIERGGGLLEVFSSEEKAKAYLEKRRADPKYDPEYVEYYVCKHRIDDPTL